MTSSGLDILGIGNAIVDVLARAGDDLLETHNMRKGSMALIGAEQAEKLYGLMGPGIESSGGSAANTCAVAAALGAKVGFLGKVADDALGRVFAHDIRAAGVHFPTRPLPDATAPTARCLIFVSPDGQRTMNTFLGACVHFSEADLDAASIAGAKVTYLEGYLFDPPAAQSAFYAASRMAHRAGRQVAITLSDAFCVERHRQAFRRFVREEADILFANEAELLSLYETDNYIEALRLAREEVGLAVLTRSEHGSIVLRGEESAQIPAVRTRVVDTTGAGDAYAAGFLAGYTRGLSLDEAGYWGAVAASEVISHFGARPHADLKARLVKAR